MKTKIKRTAFITAATSFLCFFAFSAMPLQATPREEVIEASAESVDYRDLARLDSNFEFVNGASLYKEENVSFMKAMKFRLNISDDNFLRVENKADIIVMDFTLVRASGESLSKQEAVYTVRYQWTGTTFSSAYKKHEISDPTIPDVTVQTGSVSVSPTGQPSDGDVVGLSKSAYDSGELSKLGDGYADAFKMNKVAFENQGYTLEYMAIAKDGLANVNIKTATDAPSYFDIVMKVNSQNANYFVKFDYHVRHWKATKQRWKNLFVKEYYNEYYEGEAGAKGSIKSPTRSVVSVLQNIVSAGKLETEFPDEATQVEINNIINNTSNKLITVSYLKQIGKTPFATKVTKQVTVPVLDGVILHDDVADACGESTLSAVGCAVKNFVLDSYGVYTAEYLPGVEIQIDTDEVEKNYYHLDIGMSFNDFYGQYVDKGVFGTDYTNWLLNQWKRKWVALEDYTGDNIYGLFGYFMIPEETGWTEWPDIFGWNKILKPDSDWKGTLYCEARREVVNNERYATFFEFAVNEVLNWLIHDFLGIDPAKKEYEVTHFAILGSPDVPEVDVLTKSELDVDTILPGVVQEKVDSILSTLGTIIGGATDSTGDSGLQETTADLLKTVRVTLTSVVVLAVLFGLSYLVIYLYKFSKKK